MDNKSPSGYGSHSNVTYGFGKGGNKDVSNRPVIRTRSLTSGYTISTGRNQINADSMGKHPYQYILQKGHIYIRNEDICLAETGRY